ncbi:hypothetical protein R1flu_017884 [Riccia fluitans]|uniref:Uncharacterized protein n=1 Tax=Riccia fluitans TaxID=41844 RepID=A0ABD1ZE92_9MARC
MQAEGIPAKVFFSIVSTCHYISVADKTEHLELRGMTEQRLVVSSVVVWEAFGISQEAAHDKELGTTWPNQVTLKFAEVEELGVRQYFQVSTDRIEHLIYRLAAPKEPAIVLLQIIHDYLLCKASSTLTPTRRYNLPAVSAFLRLMHYRAMNWAHMLAGGLASAIKKYVWKFLEGTTVAVVIRTKGRPTSREAEAAKGTNAGSTPELPRRFQLPGQDSSAKEKAQEVPLPPSAQQKKKKPANQTGQAGGSSTQRLAQSPVQLGEQSARAQETLEEERSDIGSRYTDEELWIRHLELFAQPSAPAPTPATPAAGGATSPVVQTITTPVERTMLDRLAKISRPKAMYGTTEEDQAIREVVLCATVASWAGELKKEVAEDRWTRSELLERANGAQAERDLARKRYEFSLLIHPTLAKLMEAMDTWVQSTKTNATHAHENATKIMEEWRISQTSLRASLDNVQEIVDK